MHDICLGLRGLPVTFDHLKKIKNNKLPVLTRGNSKSKTDVIKYCNEQNITWYNIDSGYLGNTETKLYHRISKNSYLNLEDIIDRPSDRFDKLNLSVTPFYPGRKILICPPSHKVMKIYNLNIDRWLEDTILELQKYTDREIIVRLKPPTELKFVDKFSNRLKDDIYCTVTYNSIAAVESLLHGKPTITLGPSPISSLCSTELSCIENLKYPSTDEILKVFYHLSYCQFTRDEFRTGEVWKIFHDTI